MPPAPIVRVAGKLPTIVLHALTTGFDIEQPFYAPNAFFSYFENCRQKVEFVGFFAPPLVPASEVLAYRDEPIVKDAFKAAEQRVLTLFELDELVQFAARPNKYVVLVSGPCRGCEASRARALEPLLENESLRVWTNIVTDTETCEKLLEDCAAQQNEEAEESFEDKYRRLVHPVRAKKSNGRHQTGAIATSVR